MKHVRVIRALPRIDVAQAASMRWLRAPRRPGRRSPILVQVAARPFAVADGAGDRHGRVGAERIESCWVRVPSASRTCSAGRRAVGDGAGAAAWVALVEGRAEARLTRAAVSSASLSTSAWPSRVDALISCTRAFDASGRAAGCGLSSVEDSSCERPSSAEDSAVLVRLVKERKVGEELRAAVERAGEFVGAAAHRVVEQLQPVVEGIGDGDVGVSFERIPGQLQLTCGWRSASVDLLR